jgi:thiol:disulfide interchange protein DsbA
MFKIIKQSLLILCIPLMAFAASAAEFVDGTHFKTLDNPKSTNAKVTEFFSFYCPHCYQFEPIAIALEQGLPKGASFEKSHVNFLGGIPAQVQSNLSYAYIIANQMGKGKEVAADLFDTIHKKGNRLTDIKEVKKLLAGHGISEAQFEQHLSSMLVIAQEKKMQDQQEHFGKIGALTGVPTFIVNDKYQVNMRSLKSQQELNELVKHLLEK